MPLKIGHRGTAGSAPENTLAAFRRAVALGADGVEFDVHRTRDGHLVVIHDAELNRTTTGRGRIRDLTLAQVKEADAGARFAPGFAGERVPTLREVIEALPPALRLFIELKAGSIHYPGIEADLAGLLREYGAQARCQVSSFDHQALRLLKQVEPGLQTGVIFACNPGDPVSLARWAGADGLHPIWYWVTPELVQTARQAGLGVYTWTVNGREEIEAMGRAGVDGIMSDFPERL